MPRRAVVAGVQEDRERQRPFVEQGNGRVGRELGERVLASDPLEELHTLQNLGVLLHRRVHARPGYADPPLAGARLEGEDAPAAILARDVREDMSAGRSCGAKNRATKSTKSSGETRPV